MSENPQITPFFDQPEVVAAVNSALVRVRALASPSNFEQGRNAIIIVALNLMNQIPKEFSIHCVHNIRHLGKEFIDLLRVSDDSREHLNLLCTRCMRFLSEYSIMSGVDITRYGRDGIKEAEYFGSFTEIAAFASENIEQFSGIDRIQVNYALYGTPALILQHWVHGQEAKNIRECYASFLSIKGTVAEWEKTIEEKESRVEDIRKVFGEAGDRLNIDGLASGFQTLLDEKDLVKKRLGKHMLFSRVTIIVILLFMFGALAYFLYVENTLTPQHILLGLPLSVLVAVLLYFYRVELAEYKSVCAQILQIQLRKTLCQFIQNYTSSDIADKADKKSAMGKFENVVFSGMVADDSQIPATFEGLEQLAKLVKAIRGEK